MIFCTISYHSRIIHLWLSESDDVYIFSTSSALILESVHVQLYRLKYVELRRKRHTYAMDINVIRKIT